MLPLLIPGIMSLAGNAIDSWNKAADARAAAKTQGDVDFSNLLKKSVAAAQAAPAQGSGQILPGQMEALKKQLAQSPEIQAALMQNHLSPVSVQVSENGAVSVSAAGGKASPVILGAATQALAQQIGAASASSGISNGFVVSSASAQNFQL